MLSVDLDMGEFNKILKSFEQLTPKLKRKVLRPAVRKTAKKLEMQVKANVPVQDGKMREAVISRVTPARFRGKGSVAYTIGFDTSARRADKTGTAHYPALYAYWQELGSKKMKGKGFMVRTLEYNSEWVLRNLQKEVLDYMNGYQGTGKLYKGLR